MANQAYFVGPSDNPGPGVLVLPSWWGSTSPLRRRADTLADNGFTVLLPDLNFGERPSSIEEAQTVLADADPDRLAGTVMASVDLLANRSSGSTIGVLGFGMGGSLALWSSVRRPDLIAAVVSVGATQSVDFAGATAAYQLHFAETDPFVSDDDRIFMESTMGMVGLSVTSTIHPKSTTGFADDPSETFDPALADNVWTEASTFLHKQLV